MDETALELETLNNCYSQIETFFEMVKMLRTTVYHGVKMRLVTQDQPCINLSLRDPPIFKVFMALGPNCVLLSENDEREPVKQNLVLNWERADPNSTFFDEFNKNMMTTAREWVVFPSREDAQTSAPYLSAELVEQRAGIDATRLFYGVDSERLFSD